MSSKKLETKNRILHSTWQLMESRNGLGVRMSDIAKEAGISRQALYLHFSTRKELMIATVHYVDEVKGLNERLQQFQTATTAIELLEASVDVWANHLPEIYGLAKALLSTRESDEDSAAAWNDCMGCFYEVCVVVIDAMVKEEILTKKWSRDEALEMFQTMISIYNWEQLTIDYGWSKEQYISRMTNMLKQNFVESVVS